MPDVFIKVPKTRILEQSSFEATAYFRDSDDAASAPTTARYRIDCLETGLNLVGWTALTPAVSNSITITPTVNAIQNKENRTEKKQLTVHADQNTDTQRVDIVSWKVVTNRGF